MRSKHLDSKCLDDPEHVFNDERLWAELEHPDPSRRAAALEFVDVLADLAALRATQRRTGFLIERHRIFKTRSIMKDLRSNDRELAEASRRVFVAAMMVSAVIDAERTPVTPAINMSARKLIDAARQRLAEIDATESKQRRGTHP